MSDKVKVLAWSCCLLVFLCTCSIAAYYWGSARLAGTPPTKEGIARRTNIMVMTEDGSRSDILNELRFSSITSVNGSVTLQTNPLRFGNTSGLMRYSGGHVEYSDDAGVSYYPVSLLKSPITFQNVSGQLQWDSATQAIQYSNDKGTSWQAIGSGSGGASQSVLYLPGSGDVGWDAAEDSPFLLYSSVQIAAFANLSATLSGGELEDFVEMTGRYACCVYRFGRLASGRLYWRVGRSYSMETCGYELYSSTQIVVETQPRRWREYAIQADEINNTVTFYVDGQSLGYRSYTTGIARYETSHHLYVYKSAGGLRGGPLKIGKRATWPNAADAWKGISLEGYSFPGIAAYFPLTETSGAEITEQITSTTYDKGENAVWETLPGKM